MVLLVPVSGAAAGCTFALKRGAVPAYMNQSPVYSARTNAGTTWNDRATSGAAAWFVPPAWGGGVGAGGVGGAVVRLVEVGGHEAERGRCRADREGRLRRRTAGVVLVA